MISESAAIAARLAASPWFPIKHTATVRCLLGDDPGTVVTLRDAVAHVTADGDTITITVTAQDGVTTEYRAVVQLVAIAEPAEVALT